MSSALIPFNETGSDLDLNSIFMEPVEAIDTSYLTQQWQMARDRFLFYVLTRRGMEPEALRHNTRKAYATALSQFFDGVYDSYGVDVWRRIARPWEITKEHVERWRVTLAVSGKPVMGKVKVEGQEKEQWREVGRAGISSSSLNLKLAALKEFFDFIQFKFDIPLRQTLHEPFLSGRPPMLFMADSGRHVTLWSAGAQNPFNSKAIERPQVSPYGKSTEPETVELAAIFNQINLETLTGKRDYAFLMALYSTACRFSEIANLKWGDLQSSGVKGNYTFRFRGKSGKIDQVELQREVYDDLVIYLKAAKRWETIGPDDFVFTPLFPERVNRPPGTRDKVILANMPISHDTATNILKKHARRVGIDLKKAHLHGLRHTATLQTIDDMERSQGGVDVMALKRLLRHSNLNTTQIYADKMKGADDPWAAARIGAVRPNGVKRSGRRKPVPVEQLSLSSEQELERLRAEVARLKKKIGE
jgi:integrase